MSEQWMSIVEYARRYAISDMTVRRRIKNGKLHAVLREGKYYIPLSEQVNESRTRSQEFRERELHAPVKSIPPSIASQHVRHSSGEDVPIAKPSYRFDPTLDAPPAYEKPVQAQQNQTSFDPQSILHYFEKTISQFSSVERQLRDSYETKVQGLEDRLKAKDVEIAQLQQQLEDLQTLINMIDQPVKPK